jgi:hypothetical protein
VLFRVFHLATVLQFAAMTAAKNISINRQRCEDTSNIFLSLSLPIRYFVIEGSIPHLGGLSLGKEKAHQYS